MIPCTINENSVTFFFAGRQRSIAKDHPNYELILKSIKESKHAYLEDLLNTKKTVIKYSSGNISIGSDDLVYFQDKLVPEYLATRIIEHYNTNVEFIAPLVAFAEKLMQNPNNDVRSDLYRWLEVGKMPIYEDGDFLAYKLVNNDFSPIHKGPYGQDQSPGNTVEMPRSECDENRDATCSRGLHFCSYEYLPKFEGWNDSIQNKRVILLKINPMNVVAIPRDYNNTKGRCCEFYSMIEIDRATIEEDFGDLVVVSKKAFNYDDAEVDEVFDEVFDEYQQVKDEILACEGNKTQAAKNLGISRSHLYTILKKGDVLPKSNKEIAEEAVAKHSGNKTQAAKYLGIPRSTLYRWLNGNS